jgi:uncharacterized protein (TIGR00156 family)
MAATKRTEEEDMVKLLRKAEKILLFALAVSAGFGAEAAFVPDSGRRPAGRVHTVGEVMKLPDDTRVVLRGHILNDHIRSDHYTFQDGTGSITVEIDDSEWRGLTISPADKVEVRGEVDRDLLTIEVEVDYIRKLEESEIETI